MTRPVYILNKNKKVKDIGAQEKTVFFGSDYHFTAINIPTFDLTSENPGGIVTYKNQLFGVVVVPQSITGDNSIRIMSVPLMSGLHPQTGSYSTTRTTNENNINTGFLYKSGLKAYPFDQTLYNKLNQHFDYYYRNYNANCTSSNFYDGHEEHSVWLQLTDSLGFFPNWRTANEYLQTPLNQAGPDVPANRHGSRQERGYSDGNMCCWRFSPCNGLDSTGYWYVPSQRELKAESMNASVIINAIATIDSIYNIGFQSIPLGKEGFVSSEYTSTSNTDWGGLNGKYSVTKSARVGSDGTVDPNLVQAFCKLIKVNDKWMLDPSYHID